MKHVTVSLSGLAFVALVFLAANPGAAWAHHGLAEYDMTKTISVQGTVTEFAFMNPHTAIRVDVKDDKGNVEHWVVEADSPNNLSRAGWKKDSILPGQQVTIYGNRMKNGATTMRLQKVVFSDGRELKPREGNDY